MENIKSIIHNAEEITNETLFPEPDFSIIKDSKLPPPPFPLDVFDEKWQDIMRSAAEAKACPIDYVAMSFLVAAGGLIGCSRQVNLVVGDSFDDYLLFWNARHLLPRWLDNLGLQTLIVSPEKIENAEFIEILSLLLRNKNKVTNGSGSQPNITIRSTSLDLKTLDAFNNTLCSKNRFTYLSVEILGCVSSIIPSTQELEEAHYIYSDGFGAHNKGWVESTTLTHSFIPPKAYPLHIADYQSIPPELRNGCWALDVDMERSENYSQYDNVVHHWVLPRRLRAASLFSRGEGDGRILKLPRVSKDGLLIVYTAHNESPPEINLPTNKDFFDYALHRNTNFSETASRRPYVESELSDKGRYLEAVIGLCGGLNNACSLLMHKFWKTEFARYGGKTPSQEDKFDDVVSRLKKKLEQSGSFNADTPEAWENLATAAISATKILKSSNQYTSYSALKTRWKEYVDGYWVKRDGHNKHLTEDKKMNALKVINSSFLLRPNICAKETFSIKALIGNALNAIMITGLA